ncbi:High-affnity carbon uptake protein Hat/HatR [uncultured Microscilla sp.]|uniref:nSTAND1 domain-containing NTPase n=1 Tax=uncultured Microscilla sp. TaxID=432653 RepID=UPI00262EAFA3|nr:High-affnity carbon uptake protein Hat/HatR [uncultured Microscilla sp.]
MEDNILQDEYAGINTIINPFPGLRPFSVDESYLFFGREGQSDEVLLKLAENRFVAVVGPSGSGKSSFIYCGVIPILYGGFMTDRTSNWSVVVSRPGAGPIDNLADALLKHDNTYQSYDKENKQIKKAITSTLLRSSSLGLVEAVQQTKEFKGRNVLILIDQFEELFRFKKNEENKDSLNESLAFVNLLMEAIKTTSAPIYLIITMRSDFIGDCAAFPELTESINQSYYMIPQMTRKQKQMAITGPVLVGGGMMTPRLVQKLLNDVGDNPDQLPIMQHSLMRTWDYWTDNRTAADAPLDIEHYEAIGTMKSALSQHADEAYDELTDEERKVCEVMFKALTEKGGESANGVRRPTRLGEIVAIASASEGTVIRIVEKFRQPGRSLLMPPAGIPLDDGSVIDISHESLMRIWVRLKAWVEDEGEAVQMYMRLSEASAMYQVGKSGLWRPPDLQLALNWREKHKPTLAWAQRYDPAFERAMVFLDYSQKEFETEQKIKELQQKKALRRARVTALFMGTATVISIGFLVYAISQSVEAERQKEAATKQAVIAKKNSKEADKQRKIALKREKEALTNERLAEKEKRNAEEEKKHAQEEKKHAQEEKKKADELRVVAEQKEKEANEQKQIALKNEKEAKKQTKIAEDKTRIATQKEKEATEANKKAFNLRMLSIAQSMAIKSTQYSDRRIQANNAQKAYQFNKRYGGDFYQPDIYNGLYYAIKRFEGENYNQLAGHSDAVRMIAPSYANSGQVVYSAGSDGKVLRWNLQKPKDPPKVLVSGGYIKRALVVSRDGKYLACGGDDRRVQLFTIQRNGRFSKRNIALKSGTKVWNLAFTPNNQGLIIHTSDQKIYLSDFKNATEITQLKSKVNGLAVHHKPNAESHYMAVGQNNGELVLIDRKKNNQQSVLFKNTVGMHAVAFSNSGRYLVAGDVLGIVRIWDLTKIAQNKKPIIQLEGHTAKINNIEFNKDDTQMATASFDKTVRIWNMRELTNSPIVLKDHEDWVWSIAFSNDGDYLLAGCRDNLVRIWPTNPSLMGDVLTQKGIHNFKPDEWKRYVAKDIPYEQTFRVPPKKKK